MNNKCILVLLVILASCGNNPEKYSPHYKSFFRSIVGTWQVETGKAFETWRMDMDSSFSAVAFTIEEDDTVNAERIRILEEGTRVFYEVVVDGENNNQPVRFKLTKASENELVFTNKAHDFPQEIKYEIVDENRMKATVSGTMNGELKSYVFNYIRYIKQKKVTGIGGIFFKCEDPEKIKEWYKKNLGLATDQYGSMFEFRLADEPEKKGYLQWSPFSDNTTYFEPSTKEFMINYRVENLEILVEELKRNGVTILDTIESYSYGKFIHILDPEGNKIELWEPADTTFEGETTK